MEDKSDPWYCILSTKRSKCRLQCNSLFSPNFLASKDSFQTAFKKSSLHICCSMQELQVLFLRMCHLGRRPGFCLHCLRYPLGRLPQHAPAWLFNLHHVGGPSSCIMVKNNRCLRGVLLHISFSFPFIWGRNHHVDLAFPPSDAEPLSR